MTIRFLCPMGHRLAVPDERAGKKGRCPICNQRVYIPRTDPLAANAEKKHDQSTAATARPQLAAELAAIDEPDEIVPWDESTAGKPETVVPAPANAPQAAAPPPTSNPPTSNPLASNIIARPVPPLTLGELFGGRSAGAAEAAPPAPPGDLAPVLGSPSATPSPPREGGAGGVWAPPVLNSPFAAPVEAPPPVAASPAPPAASDAPLAVPLPPEFAAIDPALPPSLPDLTIH